MQVGMCPWWRGEEKRTQLPGSPTKGTVYGSVFAPTLHLAWFVRSRHQLRKALFLFLNAALRHNAQTPTESISLFADLVDETATCWLAGDTGRRCPAEGEQFLTHGNGQMVVDAVRRVQFFHCAC
ncbi:hypothetical protein AcW2_006356 [Taiwanofungus camphoratus]|nr:hypothetical protein AcW2_006356 [Antrodia cinnamomea]KAI0921364.1 hypothetical protein AcW2_006356 [Antrodia cinnamomea]